MKGIEILAVVPARGGSKSIPRKNLKLLGDHPLIAYSVAAGLQSKYVTRTIVSTDDEEIAETARQYGADVPFLRPAELAGDTVTDLPVFQHVLRELAEREGYRPPLVVQLRPTSPFRPEGAVDGAIMRLVEEATADCVRAVTPSGQNPYKMWRLDNGFLRPLLDTEFAEPYNMPRQELPPTYWQTGHIEVIRRSTIEEKHSLTGDVLLPWIIDPQYAVDLDTPDDWAFAEYIIQRQRITFVTPGSPGN